MARRPLIEEVPLGNALLAYQALRGRSDSFLLDSGMNNYDLGRYSFAGSDPFLVLKSQGRTISLSGAEGRWQGEGEPFGKLDSLLQQYSLDPGPYPVPFVGGAVGYLSYDLCHHIEVLPTSAEDDLGITEAYLGFYGAVIGFDLLEDRAYLIATGFPELEERPRLRRARSQMESMKAALSEGLARFRQRPESSHQPAGRQSTLRSNFTHDSYLTAVEAAREYIAAGDIFEVNISQRFDVDMPLDPYQLYLRLRSINPAPFAAFLDLDGLSVVCASPERFLKLSGDLAETRPMKGTRPRGATEAADAVLAEELEASVKDRAENTMIVDLVRNDLGRVCRFGTVRVRDLWTLEKYATVFQLTSTVEGRLSPGKNGIDLLKACFPGGSITGAPKVRSMEIIDELEPTRRSVYTGSIGYFGFNGDLDLNIVIRTILVKDGKAYLQVGGAVTYDSEPESEYQETMDKARALFQSLGVSVFMESAT